MKQFEKNQRNKTVFNNFKASHDLPTLQKLLLEYQQQDNYPLKLDDNTQITSSTLFSNHTQIISTNKTITLSYNKNKDTLVKQTVVSQKRTTYVSDSYHFNDHNHHTCDCCGDEDQQVIVLVVKKIKQVTKMLKDYCNYKEITMPSEITIESMLQNLKIYSCMFHALFSQFRLLPIYCCSLNKLDEIIGKQYSKTGLNDIILKQFRQILKQIINLNDMLRGLFNLLRNPDFPIYKFTKKHKITFLMMFSETIYVEKKKKNKKKKRKTKGENGNKENQEQQEDENVMQDDYDKIMELIENLSNEYSMYSIQPCSEYTDTITAKLNKLTIKI